MPYKIKRFIDCYIPVETCNFRCPYCYITQQKMFDNKLPTFNHTPQEIANALSFQRLGGTCVLNLCGGGETLLAPEVIPIVKALLEENHIVMIVTNGVLTQRFEEIAQFPKELLERLFIKFSYHYTELLRTNQMDRFFDNIKLMAKVGVSYTLEITPYDELIPMIDDLKKTSLEAIGASPHITVARSYLKEGLPILTDLSKEEYRNTWSVFNSKLFDYKLSTFNVKRKEFCYAGDWTTTLRINTGELCACYMYEPFYNIYHNINEPIPFEAIGCNCREEHCYNSHAFISFGTIPSLNAPTYEELRALDGEGVFDCLSPAVKEVFSSKLKESNVEYNFIKKLKCNIKHSNNPFIKKVSNKFRKLKKG